MATDTDRRPARLDWPGFGPVPESIVQQLLGPGAPFEAAPEDMLGRGPMMQFVRRPRNARVLFNETAGTRPQASFMVSGDREWTVAQATAEIDALAATLQSRYGIGVGDRVAIVAANSPEYGLLLWAVLTCGAIVSSLNGWWTGAELAYGIELTAPKLIVGDTPRLARLDKDAIPAEVPVVEITELHRDASATNDPRPVLPDVDEDAPAIILFTSGTTGRAKGATLSHRNLVNFCMVQRLSAAVGAMTMPPPAGAVPAQPGTILASPMFHISGLAAIVLTGPVLGSKLVFPPPGRWDETSHLELTQRHRIASWSGVPTQWWRILRHPRFSDYDVTSVRNAGGGGASFPPDLVREFVEKMPWVSLGNGFGMSETVGIGTRIGGPVMVGTPESVGAPYFGTEVEIRDESGATMREGDIGEIFIRSASVFLGYWDNRDATAAAIDQHGWYRTGDFGRAEGGLLYLESRMRDMIIRGGENIYPIEIEHRLVEHPDIDDAVVIGVDHEVLGQEVKAFVVRRAGATLDADGVRAFAAQRLAPYKVPAYVEFRTSLPYTESGKVRKHELENESRPAHERG